MTRSAVGRDDLDLRHVLARQRPIDEAAGGAVEIPLARAGHALARVEDHVLPPIQGAGRPGGLRGKDQRVPLRVVAWRRRPATRPTCGTAHLGVPHVERRRNVLRIVGHRGQFFARGLAFPMPGHGGQQRQVPGAEVLERVGCRKTGALGQSPVHDQGAEVPRLPPSRPAGPRTRD